MSVTCRICGNEHAPAFAEPDEFETQGVLCAAMVLEHEGAFYILCVYGSEYDTDLYRFMAPPPEKWIKADPVCDRCIEDVIAQDLVEKLPGQHPFGPPWGPGIAGLADGLFAAENDDAPEA